MAQKQFNYLFAAAAAAALLLLATQSPLQAEARKFVGINQFCRTASYRRHCTQMVNGATTLEAASANAMNSTLVLAKRIRDLVPLLKPALAHLDPQSASDAMKTCNDDFDGIVEDVEVSLEAMRANDVGTVTAHLSAALRSDCEQAMKEVGADFPLKKYAGILTRSVDNCLAVIMQV